MSEIGQETVTQVMYGAWKEALSSDGLERVLLVVLVALITLPFLPFWGLLRLCEITGHYDIEGGFSL